MSGTAGLAVPPAHQPLGVRGLHPHPVDRLEKGGPALCRSREGEGGTGRPGVGQGDEGDPTDPVAGALSAALLPQVPSPPPSTARPWEPVEPRIVAC